jgi:hypothetical protein
MAKFNQKIENLGEFTLKKQNLPISLSKNGESSLGKKKH